MASRSVNRKRMIEKARLKRRLLRAVYYALADPKLTVRLRKMDWRWCGEWSEGNISLNYREDVITTAMHECLHHYYPEKSESWVEQAELFLARNISERQATNILKRVVERLR